MQYRLELPDYWSRLEIRGDEYVYGGNRGYTPVEEIMVLDFNKIDAEVWKEHG